MKFGKVLKKLEEGKLFAREGWNGKNMFIFYLNPSLEKGFISLDLQGLTENKGVLKYFENFDLFDRITINPFLCIKNVNDSITFGWVPSQTDMTSDDWVEIKVID